MPLTPTCSSTSRDNSVVAEEQLDACTDSNGGDNANGGESGNGNQVDLAFSAHSLRDNEIFQHNNNRIPFDHAPIYFFKVLFTPPPLR